MKGKRMMSQRQKTGPGHSGPEPVRVHSPALAWLSLVGLLLSIAQLRFARQHEA